MAWRMSSEPCFLSSRYWWALPGNVKIPLQYSGWLGVKMPYFWAASAYSGLTVDPGG